MKNQILWRITSASVVGAVGLMVAAQGALALSIDPGFDLFNTPPGGAFADLTDFGLGVVDLQGNPIGPGNTDTIVERFSGLPDNGIGLIDVEIVALSLVSVDPVAITDPMTGVDSFFDVFVDLSPAAPSAGNVEVLTHDANGGTFDSFFDVFVDVRLVEVGNPSNVQGPFSLQDVVTSTDSLWSHSPPPAYPEGPNFPAGNFYPGVDPDTGDVVGVVHTGPHPKTDPSSPEPSSVVLLMLGAIGLASYRFRRCE